MQRRRLLSVAGIVVAAGLAVATSREVTLKASVVLTETELVVTNRDDFEWTHVTLVPAPCLVPLRRTSLAAGHPWTVPLADLRHVNGKPFDARSLDVKAISIDAAVVGGSGSFGSDLAGRVDPSAGC